MRNHVRNAGLGLLLATCSPLLIETQSSKVTVATRVLGWCGVSVRCMIMIMCPSVTLMCVMV